MRTPTVAIVGAGMSGLCMGMKLKRAGIESFTIYEKADRVGGTWRENTYPGLRCDVPSLLYQYSFDPNPDWSHTLLAGRRDLALLRGRDRPPRAAAPTSSSARRSWTPASRTGAGASARATATRPRRTSSCRPAGCSTTRACRRSTGSRPSRERPSTPPAGTTRWTCEGKRVAVVGTGSTGVQIVTALAESAGRLTLFQRTAQWILPIPNLPASRPSRALMRRFPLLSRLGYRWTQAVFELFAVALIRPGWQRSLDLLGLPPQPAPGEGPGAAARAEARLPADVQAARALERLLQGDAARQRRARDRCDRPRRAGGRGHRGRQAPRARRARAGHRFRRPRLHAPDGADGQGRPDARATRGATGAAPIAPSPSRASRTSSCCSGPTARSATSR